MTASLNTPVNINLTSYHAAGSGAALYHADTLGRVRMLGRDRAELLHRLSTNDIRALTPGRGARTVLTNHNGRIIDLLTVYALPEHLLLITSPTQGPAVRKLLKRNIFFNDKAEIEEITDGTVQINLYGPAAVPLLLQLSGLDVADWDLHHIQAIEIDGAGAWLARILPLGDGRAPAFTLLALQDDWQRIAPHVATLPQIDEATYQLLRIEAGYPAWQHEISLEYIPLETRLRDAISFTKGCYIGQEIIARMDSRGRMAKQLMHLYLAAPVEPDTKLTLDGKEQGILTSCAQSPTDGPIGLGYVRMEQAQPGAVLQAGDVRVEVGEPAGG